MVHFEFNEWEKAFAWYFLEQNNDMQMVVSTHPYTSGYWIEKIGSKICDTDLVYKGQEVRDLFLKIRTEVQLSKKQFRTASFTI